MKMGKNIKINSILESIDPDRTMVGDRMSFRTIGSIPNNEDVWIERLEPYEIEGELIDLWRVIYECDGDGFAKDFNSAEEAAEYISRFIDF